MLERERRSAQLLSEPKTPVQCRGPLPWCGMYCLRRTGHVPSDKAEIALQPYRETERLSPIE